MFPSKICASCGAANDPSGAYCSHCGRPLAGSIVVAPAAPPPYASYPAPSRAANFSSILSGMFGTWTKNFWSFFLVFLILGLVTGGVGMALSYGFFGVVATGGFGAVPGTAGISSANLGLLALYFLVFIVVTVVVTTIVEGAMAEYSVRRFRGEPMEVEHALRRGVAKFLSVFGATLIFVLIVVGIIVLPILLVIPLVLTGAAPGLGAVLLLAVVVAMVVAIYVGLALCLFAPAIMIEDASAVGSLSRSWSLTRGHRASLFGAVLIVVIVSAIIEEVFVVPASLTGIAAASVVAVAVSGAIVSPWLVILTGVAYDLFARPYPAMPPGGASPPPGTPSPGPFGAPPSIPPGAFSPPGQ